MSIVTVGIDLAKNIFAVHGVDENGKAVLIKPKVSRDQLLPLIVQMPPATRQRRANGVFCLYIQNNRGLFRIDLRCLGNCLLQNEKMKNRPRPL